MPAAAEAIWAIICFPRFKGESLVNRDARVSDSQSSGVPRLAATFPKGTLG
jgi:hypothetical protein